MAVPHFSAQQPRTLQQHQVDSSFSSEAPTNSRLNVVNHQSNILNLFGFNIFAQALYHPMHIIAEGVVPHTMKTVFGTLIKKKVLRLSHLDLFNNFEYGNDLKLNRPSKISTLCHLNQTAAQNLTIFFSFFFVFSSTVSDDCSEFHILFLLSDVLSLILSPNISVKHVFILTHRISLFL